MRPAGEITPLVPQAGGRGSGWEGTWRRDGTHEREAPSPTPHSVGLHSPCAVNVAPADLACSDLLQVPRKWHFHFNCLHIYFLPLSLNMSQLLTGAGEHRHLGRFQEHEGLGVCSEELPGVWSGHLGRAPTLAHGEQCRHPCCEATGDGPSTLTPTGETDGDAGSLLGLGQSWQPWVLEEESSMWKISPLKSL